MRKNRFLSLLLSAHCLTLGAEAVHAQIPQFIRYQGTVVNASNVPLEGTYALTFRLYDAPVAGTLLWSEVQTQVPISRGIFNVLLGQVNPLTLPFEGELWLSTQVGSDGEMSPRQRLTSVPYAYRAQVADQVQDQPPGFEVDTGGTLTDGLIAYWKLDESSGMRDDQKGPYDLTDNNTVTQASGKKAQAARFVHANSEYLSIADNAELSTGQISFTVAAWVYLDTLPSSSKGGIVGKYGGVGNFEYFLAALEETAGVNYRFRFAIASQNGGASASAESANQTATGAWLFVIGWRDFSARTVNLQVNGGPVVSKVESVTVADGPAALMIGRRESGNLYWDGRIDEVGFWKRVLTSQERADLYNNGSGNTYVLGKAASPWTKADAGIAYTEGRLGIGTLTIPNILSVQQGSPTDPIADSWTVYPSDRQHKQIAGAANPGYLNRIKAIDLYEWTRTPSVSDDEVRLALRKSRPDAEEFRRQKQELSNVKAKLPKFTTKRVGMVIDDDAIPPEVLSWNTDGSKAGIDLLGYLGYLHAALKEAALKIEELESRLPQASP